MSLAYCPACHCDGWLYRHSGDEHCRKFRSSSLREDA